jgi:DNA invertase Pin-like site-specific DNA recombinase
VLTIAYCRVSTEEQAEEGFSIEGQTDKLRAYSTLRDLGEVTIITDPGRSGKDMLRPGLQQLLAAVEAGHVRHVLVWRLDRLSRNLGDLILLADKFGESGVSLHSVSENLDLSSAAGRMFYNVLGSFAQYFREQLSENVRMGNERAIKEGRWINRPKTGYDLVDGLLVPNADAQRVREVFGLRAERHSYRSIEERTGIKYSTICTILTSRIYLGEVLHNHQWFKGFHEPLVTPELFGAAQRAVPQGVQPSRDVLSGRVRCGLCGRRMAIQQNGKGSIHYSCRHRGQGCDQPVRSTRGLARGVVLGMTLLGHDEQLQAAIRVRLSGGDRLVRASARRTRRAAPHVTLETLSDQRRKLLQLFYADQISAEGFHDEESRLAESIEATRMQVAEETGEDLAESDLHTRFEEVVNTLQELDPHALWNVSEDRERRHLVEEMVTGLSVFPDHLEVTVTGAPTLNVLYREIGMRESEIVQVGEPTYTI